MTVFTDKIDVNEKISLYEYGFIRNPMTGKTVICSNLADHLYNGAKPKVRIQYISFDDVYEYLEDENDSFYEYLSNSKEQVLRELDNDNLVPLIYALNQYGGVYEQYW